MFIFIFMTHSPKKAIKCILGFGIFMGFDLFGYFRDLSHGFVFHSIKSLDWVAFLPQVIKILTAKSSSSAKFQIKLLVMVSGMFVSSRFV